LIVKPNRIPLELLSDYTDYKRVLSLILFAANCKCLCHVLYIIDVDMISVDEIGQ